MPIIIFPPKKKNKAQRQATSQNSTHSHFASSYVPPCTWKRLIRACTDSHCTSLYLVYLPALTGSLITTKLPPLSLSASSPVLPLVNGSEVLVSFPVVGSSVKRLSTLLTTPLHSLGQALGWCLCSHRSDSAPENGKLALACVFPYNMKSSESSE